MGKKIFCGHTDCEHNSLNGIKDAESGICSLDDCTIGRSGFCLACSTVDRDVIDKLEESEGETLESQEEEL